MIEVIDFLEKTNDKTCVALGFFDGVHRGHEKILKNAVKTAQEENLVAAVFTFSQNPQEILMGKKIKKLSNISKKEKLLERIGIKKVYVVDFSNLMLLSAEEFIEKILIKTLNAKHVFCGFNYNFGFQGRGNCEYLKESLRKKNVKVSIEKPVNFKGRVISSSRIRGLILTGNIEEANEMLTMNFGFAGKVKEGKKIGRTIGFPTINQDIPKDLILPKFGAYQSKVIFDGREYDSLTNIGVDPTVTSESLPCAETFILGYEKNAPSLYEKEVNLELIKFLRPEQKFASLRELRNDLSNLVLKV